MKRVISLLLSVLLVVGCLTGCSGNGDGGNQGGDTPADKPKIGVILVGDENEGLTVLKEHLPELPLHRLPA